MPISQFHRLESVKTFIPTFSELDLMAQEEVSHNISYHSTQINVNTGQIYLHLECTDHYKVGKSSALITDRVKSYGSGVSKLMKINMLPKEADSVEKIVL